MTNQNQKGGVLEGGALTDETLASSKSVLDLHGAQTKGLQQFYSPKEMAEFAARMSDGKCTLDLTAGDGSLLQNIRDDKRFGIEIDADQIGSSNTAGQKYHAVQGDTQHVVPLLVDIGAGFGTLALNPPYGLKWEDPTIFEGAPTNSCVSTWHYAARLLSREGSGLMLCGGDGKFDNIREKIKGVKRNFGYRDATLIPYCVVTVPDMFDDVQSSTDIVLFGWAGLYGEAVDDEPVRIEARREELDQSPLIDKVKELRDERLPEHRTYENLDTNRLSLIFRAAQEEYDKRLGLRIPQRKKDYDIYGGAKKLVVDPRPYTRLLLQHSGSLRSVTTFHGQPLKYFVLNKKEWDKLQEIAAQGTILIEPALVKRIDQMIQETQRDVIPMYAVKPQQRLAWLADLDEILCTKTPEDKRFKEGVSYRLHVQSVIQQSRERARPVVNKRTGDITLKDFIKERKVLNIRIQGHGFSETTEDITYLIDHFAIPDPGTIADAFPVELARNIAVLDGLETGKSWKFKPFQKDDIARLMVKGGGLLAWEQGLGKTLAGMSFELAMAELENRDPSALIVAPQDLIPYWIREAKKFYGVNITWLRNRRDFRLCRQARGKGIYITHYEALSRAGKMEKVTEVGSIKVKYVRKDSPASREYEYDAEENKMVAVDHPAKTWLEPVTDATHCPRCASSYREGYDPNVGCKAKDKITGTTCDWSRFERRVKPLYDTIKTTFRQGTLIIDELTKIKGDYSARSECIRGINAKHVLGMTGTPVKNYIPDAFWGLWKCLGDSSSRFPYAYSGGKTRFENDFAVIEHAIGGGGRRENRKVLPEVSNLLVLWRLLSASIIRKRKEETGETLVRRTFYPTLVPLGVRQRAQAERWLHSFGQFFKEQNPEHPVVQAGMQETLAALLGQLWKLEFAATMPLADPHHDYWTEHAEERLRVQPVSNWTPANARVLELAMHHAAKGDKVLIGSDIKMPGRWLVDELKTRGVRAANVLKESDGHPETKSPAARAKIVEQFQRDKIDVLVATTEALNLGHNLDVGNVVILSGLPWDFATMDQFIARIHRLTSKRDVKVYVIVPYSTLTARKWKLLIDKGAAAGLALDGRLIEQDEEQIDQATILKQMVEAGIPVDGTEVEEDDIERAWLEIKSADDLPELILEGAGVDDLTELDEDEGMPMIEPEVEEIPDPDNADDGIDDDLNADDEPEHEWRAEFDVGEGIWHTNAMRYETYAEALEAAVAKYTAWTMAKDFRVVNEETPLREAVTDIAEPEQAERVEPWAPEVRPDPQAYPFPIGPAVKPVEVEPEPEIHPALVQHPDLAESVANVTKSPVVSPEADLEDDFLFG